jgi:hypothetical protein
MDELTPAKWKQLIDRSLRLQRPRLDEADRFLRAYTGDYSTKGQDKLDENRDEMNVNFVYSMVETAGPSIFAGTPKAFCEAQNPEGELWSDHYQSNLNHWGRVLGLKRHFNRCRFDRFFGLAAMLTEWDYEEVEVEEDNILYMDPSSGRPVLGKPKMVLKVLRDRPLVRRISPRDVILDPDSDFREEDRWRGLRIKMRKSEFDRLPGVTPELRENVQGRALSSDLSVNPSGSRDRYTDSNMVVLYKIYDLETETVKLIVDGEPTKDFIEMKPWPWLFEVENDRFPITVLDSKIDEANPYPFSEFKAFWPQIQEQNKVRTMLQSHVRRNAPGWLARKGMMDEAEKEKLAGADIAEIIEVSKLDGIVAKPMSALPKEFFGHSVQVKDDVVNISGFYEFQNDDTVSTATEASIVQGRSNIRKGDAKRSFGDFQAMVFGKMGQLCQQYQDEAVAVQIRKPENKQELIWVNVNREKIIGEFGVTVKPAVDENDDEGLFRQQLLKFAEVMANNPHTDQRWLARELCKAFKREPDMALKPMGQVMQELAQKAQAESGQQKPPISFKPIDPAMLAQLSPEVLAMLIQAGLVQNGVAGGGVPQGGIAPAASPSMAGPPPDFSVMPGAEMNQAPPALPGGMMPPATPVQPLSEFQGGSQ